jgi:hypothetical protein
MTSKTKHILTFALAAILLLAITNKVHSQGLLDKILNKADKALTAVDKALDPKASNSNKKNNDKEKAKSESEQTIINENDFVQNDNFPEKDPNNSRIKIAKNLVLDIKGKYPLGYTPKWRFISYKSDLDFDVENYIVKRSTLGHGKRSIAISDYNGKAMIRFGAFITCDCYAEIVIKDSQNVITETPQTFKVTNFLKIVNERITGEKCKSLTNNMHTDGGWEGQVTLSANEDGDIKMDLMIENYRLASRFAEAGVSYRYVAKGIIIENEMSAQKAIAIIEAEKIAKQKQKDYVAKTTKQADSLQKIIAKKYPQTNCKECFYSSSGGYISTTKVDQYYVGSGDYAGSYTDWDLNVKTVIQNKCNYGLTFIGLQQLYDEERGYYLIEVTKTMEKGYSYSSDQGAMASVFTSLIGGGSEFNIKLQDKYYPTYATVGSVQWLKVIKK